LYLKTETESRFHFKIEKFIDEIIQEGLKINLNNQGQVLSKYPNIKHYIIFFYKYFFYILMKQEIRCLTKNNAKRSNFINYKNFSFCLNEYGKEFLITLNHFNFFEMCLKISKESIPLPGEEAFLQNTDFLGVDQSKIINYEISRIEPLLSSNTRSKPITNIEALKLSQFIKILIENLLFDIRIYKYIKELNNYFQSIDNSNMPQKEKVLMDIIDVTIFIKNITKIANTILRKTTINLVNKIIDKSTNYYTIKNNYVNCANQLFNYKFLLIKNSSFSSNILSKIEFSIVFLRNSFYIEIKNPVKNNIYICERETISEKHYEKLDMPCLLHMIENMLSI
jgi:hypothetical protein